jgi:uncharacterized membrane protein YedE/YeeE
MKIWVEGENRSELKSAAILIIFIVGLTIGIVSMLVASWYDDITLASNHKMKLCYYAGQNILPVYRCTLVPRGKGW